MSRKRWIRGLTLLAVLCFAILLFLWWNPSPDSTDGERSSEPTLTGEDPESSGSEDTATARKELRGGKIKKSSDPKEGEAQRWALSSITGRVVEEETDTPLSGATVRIAFDAPSDDRDVSPWLQSVRTGEQGSFEFPRLWFAPYKLHAHAPGRRAGELPSVFPVAEVEFSLAVDPGIPARIEVDRDGDMEPLPRRRIFLEIPRAGWSLEAVSDGEGNFTISGLDGDRLREAVRGWEVEVIVPGFAEADLDTDPDGETFVVTVEPGVAVVGQVIDSETSSPLPDAVVWSDSGDSVRTDVGGQFRLDGVSDAITAHAPGYAIRSKEIDGGEHREGKILELEIKLARGVTIFGKVTDAKGQPLRGVKVEILQDDLDMEADSEPLLRNLAAILSTVTDAAGRYRLEGVSPKALDLPGTLDLSVCPPGSRNGVASEVEIEKKEGEFEHDIVLDLIPSLRGRVVSGGGEPLPGAHVLVESTSEDLYQASGTNQAGEFELRYLPPGEYLLAVVAGEHPVLVSEVSLPVESLDLRVESGESVRGQVVSDKDGKPLAGILVSLVFHAGELHLSREGVTDAEGGFRFGDVPRGEHSLLLTRRRGSPPFSTLTPQLQRRIPVRKGGWREVIRYPVLPAGRIVLSFAVQGEDGTTRIPDGPVDVSVVLFRPMRSRRARVNLVSAAIPVGRAVGDTFTLVMREGSYLLRCVLSSGGQPRTKEEKLIVRDGKIVERKVVFTPP